MREEFALLHIGCVRFVAVQFRDIPFDENLQVADINEAGGVRNDGREEAVVELVSAKLLPAVILPGDNHALESQRVLQDVHVRIKAQLPAAVLHGRGDNHLKAKVNPAVALCYVSETGGNHGRIQYVRSHHLAGGLVADRFHDEHVFPVLVFDGEGVAPGHRDDFAFLLYLVAGKGDARRQLLPADGVNLAARPAGGEKRCSHRHGGCCQDYSAFHFLLIRISVESLSVHREG